jgi:hypothetical protein
MSTRGLAFAVAIVVGMGALSAQGQTCYGPADFDTNGTVDLGDYRLFEQCVTGPGSTEPPPGCPADLYPKIDLDGDGDADLADFATFTVLFHAEYFDFGQHRDNLETEMLAMQVSGELRAPDAEYARIGRDMELIRDAYPELITVIDDPDYVPNQLIVSLLDGIPWDGYHALNAYFQVIDEEIHSFFRLLTFCDNLHAPVLRAYYEALPEMNYAEPNYYLGMDDEITIGVLGTTYRYTIDDGFLDCFDGCDCHRVWTIDVTEEGAVMLVSYNEWGMPWCEF